MGVTGAKSRGGRSSDVERDEGKEEGEWKSTENWCVLQELQNCEPQEKKNWIKDRREELIQILMKGMAQMRFTFFFHLYDPHVCGHDEDNYVITM